MRALRRLISVLLVATLGACAAQSPPHRRPDALSQLARASAAKADELLPSEYNNARETFIKADQLLQKGEKKEAAKLYLLAEQEAVLVRKRAETEAARRAEEAKRIAAEEARLAEEKRKAEEAERAEAARQAREKAAEEAAEEAAAKAAAAEAARKKVKPPPPEKQHLVASYTVRRGQSLPLIAAQPEVYNDRNLWPLLYRANRDQISDPRHLWPGQVLRVPRNSSRDDIAEARRYALEKPLH